MGKQGSGSTAQGSVRGHATQQRGQARVRQYGRGVRQGLHDSAEGSDRVQAAHSSSTTTCKTYNLHAEREHTYSDKASSAEDGRQVEVL